MWRFICTILLLSFKPPWVLMLLYLTVTSSLSAVLKMGAWASVFLRSAKTQIAPLHYGIFSFLLHSQGHDCTPCQRQAATLWASLPSSLGAQCQSRAEKEDTSVGQRAVMSERIQEGWVDGEGEGRDPACTPSRARRQRKGKSIF